MKQINAWILLITFLCATTASPADQALDADRRPTEAIAFAKIKPGDKVADFMPGDGDVVRILCGQVGDTGHVYAISLPLQSSDAMPATRPSTRSSASAPACRNVTNIALQRTRHAAPELHSDSDDPGWVYEYWTSRLPAESFAAPELLDAIFIVGDYHTLHTKASDSPDMALVNMTLLKALKPGGLLIIEDDAAAAGSGARDAETRHRIDPALVKQEVTATGFELVSSNDAPRPFNDSRASKSRQPNGNVDRLLFKFRKPLP